MRDVFEVRARYGIGEPNGGSGTRPSKEQTLEEVFTLLTQRTRYRDPGRKTGFGPSVLERGPLTFSTDLGWTVSGLRVGGLPVSVPNTSKGPRPVRYPESKVRRKTRL